MMTTTYFYSGRKLHIDTNLPTKTLHCAMPVEEEEQDGRSIDRPTNRRERIRFTSLVVFTAVSIRLKDMRSTCTGAPHV